MSRTIKISLAAAAAVAAVALPAAVSTRNAADSGAKLPPAAVVERPAGTREVAVLAGGCFWGIEGVYEHVKGVIDVRTGYAGGSARTASYDAVSSGTTGKAEAVRIVFDPQQVGYAELLRIYFSVAHDPTEVNRQGPDVGTQYRSAIFPQTPAQARVARAYIAQLGKAGVFKRPIATKIETGAFAEAEPYHQDFMRRNPAYPYIVINDRPKLAALKRQFPAQWKS
ncbi:peptide-methionine (S)-S-oxide reductase MsrA [Sphingomonas sp. G124]|uniref:Peptide methionine sulfoxide reductase MsrA n=1 Tax=Sphingomonas cremea TaxID=2904799 RepID=A0A9X1TY18_9SPHN|nr:peptide-methionine (S)-S-oxide reductase MsrA [Sphingomonas cremea]MCF2515800.1 peptide-methionine (S)-S-oxide reductase MsrA [Sphingomonas cremea]